jgi:hypothetical protein
VISGPAVANERLGRSSPQHEDEGNMISPRRPFETVLGGKIWVGLASWSRRSADAVPPDRGE